MLKDLMMQLIGINKAAETIVEAVNNQDADGIVRLDNNTLLAIGVDLDAMIIPHHTCYHKDVTRLQDCINYARSMRIEHPSNMKRWDDVERRAIRDIEWIYRGL
jgi:ribosomal silencing factor RsfS